TPMEKKPWPSEVVTERTPQGMRFIFRRRSGPLRVRHLVGILVYMGIITACAGGFWAKALWSPAGDREVLIFFAGIVSLGILGVIWFLIWGEFGHSEIAIEGGHLVASDLVAGIRFRVHRQPLRTLRRLEITTRTLTLGGQEARVRNQREL